MASIHHFAEALPPSRMLVTGWQVFLHTLPMALATGLGAVPFFWMNSVSKTMLGHFNAAAAGVVLTASFGLIYEGVYVCGVHPGAAKSLTLGLLFGVCFIVISQSFVEKYEKYLQVGQLGGMDARKALIVVGVMTLHSFSEGLGVGVSYGGEHGYQKGPFISAAIALHNVPEGLAIALVLVPKGEKVWRAMLYACFSSMPQPIVAVPAFLFIELFEKLLPFGLGFAAGTMVWMVFAHLLPDALEHVSASQAATTITLSATFMVYFQMLIA